MKTKALNFLSDTGLGFLRWIKNNVLEQDPKPVAIVRVIRFLFLCSIAYFFAVVFLLLK
jgi:hypothetical protein